MAQLTQYVIAYGLPLIFGIVLLEQLGAPIPAIPVLIVAGALSVDRDLSASAGPARRGRARRSSPTRVWYLLGRSQGNRILKTLCRISLSPDSCVRQTESVFERWGMPSLLVAKFIPGFSTVAPPMAGAIGASVGDVPALRRRRAPCSGRAPASSAAMLFHRAIDRVLGVSRLDRQRRLRAARRRPRPSSSPSSGGSAGASTRCSGWRGSRSTTCWRLMDEGQSPIVLDVRTDKGALARSAQDPGRRGARRLRPRRARSRSCRGSGRSSSTARDPTKPRRPVWPAC